MIKKKKLTPWKPKKKPLKLEMFKKDGEGDIKLISKQDVVDLCKWKHYRFGFSGMSNYGRIKSLLAELGFNEEEIKLCLHP